ncbi:MAG: UvrD-helicase domain-containing protein, partial [Firmicutes bacterium]|nr:UvrD-helicase domain-containing protein [Bacillota bacterium]
MSFDLSQLNEEQMLAVRHTEGGVLVSTGAGSGKTRVLTHRIVHLVADKGVRGYNILAVTFTNKAASEMLERLQTMTNDHTATAMTFHSLCVRILRRDCDKLGYSKNFSIYDESDKEKVIKAIVKEITEDDIYKESISAISHAKNHGMSPSKYNTEFGDYNNGKIIAKIYQAYE